MTKQHRNTNKLLPYFNSHAHVERDGWKLAYIRRFDISTHTLTWSVTYATEKLLPELFHFNSHAHVERDHVKTRKTFKYFYFNSHAHVERDRSLSYLHLMRIISTHTLTWSVTDRIYKAFQYWKISTHTLTWSVTWLRGYL